MRAKEKAGFSLVENPGLPSAPIRVCRPVSDQHYTREKAKRIWISGKPRCPVWLDSERGRRKPGHLG